jgi:hypothetical protein
MPCFQCCSFVIQPRRSNNRIRTQKTILSRDKILDEQFKIYGELSSASKNSISKATANVDMDDGVMISGNIISKTLHSRMFNDY